MAKDEKKKTIIVEADETPVQRADRQHQQFLRELEAKEAQWALHHKVMMDRADESHQALQTRLRRIK